MNPFAKGKEGKAFTTKFPKPKDEGWFLVLGCVEDGELLALKRSGASRTKRSLKAPKASPGVEQQLTFFTPLDAGRVIYTLYIISDCYLGLDQQYDVYLDVEEGFSEVRALFGVHLRARSSLS